MCKPGNKRGGRGRSKTRLNERARTSSFLRLSRRISSSALRFAISDSRAAARSSSVCPTGADKGCSASSRSLRLAAASSSSLCRRCLRSSYAHRMRDITTHDLKIQNNERLIPPPLHVVLRAPDAAAPRALYARSLSVSCESSSKSTVRRMVRK